MTEPPTAEQQLMAELNSPEACHYCGFPGPRYNESHENAMACVDSLRARIIPLQSSLDLTQASFGVANETIEELQREKVHFEFAKNPIVCKKGHRFYAAVNHPAKSECEWECPNCLSEELHTLKRHHLTRLMQLRASATKEGGQS